LELWLDRAARERPDALAVNELTYGDLDAQATACAAALANARIGRGERVATTLGGVDLAVLLHALPKLGAVLVPLDGRLTTRERDERLAISRPALVVERRPDGARPKSAADGAANPGLGDPFAVVFTSGTTGAPKPVELTYGNFAASAQANAANLGVDPGDRWLCCMPLFHVGGLSILTRSAIYMTHAVVHDGFDVDAVADALMHGDVTIVSLVATQLRRLLDAGIERPPRLRAALIGGGPVPADLVERARAAGIPVLRTYGMTETCSQIWTERPLPGAEIETTPEGELLVRGPMVAPGAIAEDGWLHTGDRGRIDADGTLHVEGRIADTIVTGGENVAAAEVEEALLAHPAVEDAAVVGRPDPEWGQAVHAFVVAVGDTSDLDAHLRDRLAGFKRPKQIHRVAEIPRTASGKVIRGRLA
jgi:O-succinylbenzoic acid--CoA ligase